MSARRDSLGRKEAPLPRETRRTSLARREIPKKPEAQSPVQSPAQGPANKRCLSTDLGSQKKKKMESGEAAGTGSLAELKDLIQGLHAKIGGVKDDIGSVKKDLSEQVAEGNRETKELRKRMDESDATFESRVLSIVTSHAAGLVPSSGNPGLPGSSSGASGGGSCLPGHGPLSYAACLGGPASASVARTDPKEDAYWRCRRTERRHKEGGWRIPQE